MKALNQLQELIGSLQKIKAKLESMVFPVFQSHKHSNDRLFKDVFLSQIGSLVQNHIESCKVGFLAKINLKLQEYEVKSGQKLILNRQLSLSESDDSNAVTGENLMHLRKELFTQSDDKILGPILQPNFREQLNHSQDVGVKPPPSRSPESNRSYQQSHQSYYTAIESQNLQDLKYNYLARPNLETSSLRQDHVKVLNEDILEKFQSLDDGSEMGLAVRKMYLDKEIQTVKGVMKIKQVYRDKIVIRKKEHKLAESKRSTSDGQDTLLDIIYGKDLLPFIKFYCNQVKQNRILSTSKSNKSYTEQELSGEFESEKLKERSVLYPANEEQYNPLIKYLTKGNSLDDLSVDEVMEAKFQRLVVICFDTLLTTMKTMSYFMQAGELTEIIRQVEKEELNVYKKRCLGSQEKEIEKVCKNVKRLMRYYRVLMKDNQPKRHFFDKTIEIKTQVV